MTTSPERTIYDVQLDLDLDALLDDAVEDPHCEWKTARDVAPCGAAATWLVVFSCGHSTYFDDAHYEANNRYFAEHAVVGCGKEGAPDHLYGIRTIIASTHRIAS
jgi:hypothetical protein